jgi:hypothetical protein
LPGREALRRRETAFGDADHTYLFGRADSLARMPGFVARHPRDPHAIVLRALRPPTRITGAWAGKIGAHRAHHGFGGLGRLPHLQLNVWRVGVKGSGVSFRMPLVSPSRALDVMTSLLA